jgi:hypothetical protein
MAHASKISRHAILENGEVRAAQAFIFHDFGDATQRWFLTAQKPVKASETATFSNCRPSGITPETGCSVTLLVERVVHLTNLFYGDTFGKMLALQWVINSR